MRRHRSDVALERVEIDDERRRIEREAAAGAADQRLVGPQPVHAAIIAAGAQDGNGGEKILSAERLCCESSGSPRYLIADDGVEDDEQSSGDSDEGELGGLTCGAKALVGRLEGWVAPGG